MEEENENHHLFIDHLRIHLLYRYRNPIVSTVTAMVKEEKRFFGEIILMRILPGALGRLCIGGFDNCHGRISFAIQPVSCERVAGGGLFFRFADGGMVQWGSMDSNVPVDGESGKVKEMSDANNDGVSK